jgi:predicted NBD/HSP70 family sugar kinase
MFLGVDIAQDDVACILSHPDGSSALALRAPLPPRADVLQVWKTAVETAQETLLRGFTEPGKVAGAVLALDAPIDEGGVVGRSPHAEGWQGFDLARGLSENLGIERVWAVSRVGCEAAGEERFGALRNAPLQWLYVHLGATLSGAVRQSSTRSNDSLRVVTLGELCIERDGVLGSAGRRGTLEAYCSRDSFLTNAASYGLTLQSAADIWAARSGNFAAQSLCEDYSRRLAQGLGSAVALLAARRVVLGSSLAHELGEVLLVGLRADLPEFCAAPLPEVNLGLLGRDAAVLGAVALAIEKTQEI